MTVIEYVRFKNNNKISRPEKLCCLKLEILQWLLVVCIFLGVALYHLSSWINAYNIVHNIFSYPFNDFKPMVIFHFLLLISIICSSLPSTKDLSIAGQGGWSWSETDGDTSPVLRMTSRGHQASLGVWPALLLTPGQPLWGAAGLRAQGSAYLKALGSPCIL